MKEYVEREAAVKAAKDGADAWDGGCSRYRDASIESAINDIPAADVVEVRHGRWIIKDESYWRPHHSGDIQVNKAGRHCSICNKRLSSTQKFKNYCPYCGAKMDGGVNDAAD